MHAWKGRPWGLALVALASTGCMAQATEEWALHTPDAAPRVTRIDAGNDLVERGPLVRGELLVADRLSGVSVRSGGLGGGYGWTDIAPNECMALNLNLLGRISVGRPAMLYTGSLDVGAGHRIELSLSAPKDHENEKLTLVAFKPELVFAFDMTYWTQLDERAIDLSAGVGLRFGVISEAGPPLSRALRLLL